LTLFAQNYVRYGAVVRNRDPNKYMPPQLRKLQEQQQLQGSSAVPAVKKPEPTKEPVKDVKIKPAEESKPTKQTPSPPTTTTATTTTSSTTSTTPPAVVTVQKIPPFSSSAQFPARVSHKQDNKNL
jgi:hypothetical protein